MTDRSSGEEKPAGLFVLNEAEELIQMIDTMLARPQSSYLITRPQLQRLKLVLMNHTLLVDKLHQANRAIAARVAELEIAPDKEP